MAIYYRFVSSTNTIYLNNAEATPEYQPWYKNQVTLSNKYVVTELTNGKFVFPENCSEMFSYVLNTTFSDTDKWDMSNVTNMDEMFIFCENLEYIDASTWNVSKVTSMKQMFRGCRKLTSIDGIGNWNTSKVRYFTEMFENCNSITHFDFTPNFDTSYAYDMMYMFYNCNSLQELDLHTFSTEEVIYGYNFDTSRSTSGIDYMFFGCTNLRIIDISGFDFTKIYAGSYNPGSARVFYNDYNLEHIYTRKNENWTNNFNSTDCFYNCLKLPGYSEYIVSDPNYAKTAKYAKSIRSGGYFEDSPYIYMDKTIIFEKYNNSWKQCVAYDRRETDSESTTPWKEIIFRIFK